VYPALNLGIHAGCAGGYHFALTDQPAVRLVGVAAMWSQVIQHGCRIWLTRRRSTTQNFMLVDGCWVLVGSANWDARSLRLNFEFNLECYDVELAAA